MKYEEARELIQEGDVIALSHEGWGSREDLESQAVRFFTRSEFSHVATVFQAGDRVEIIEAVVPKVRIIPLSEMAPPFYWIPMRRPLSAEAIKYARSLEGQDYSKLEAILGYLGWDRECNGKWQCAELSRSISKRNGLTLDCKSTPTAVVRACMELHNPLILVT